MKFFLHVCTVGRCCLAIYTIMLSSLHAQTSRSIYAAGVDTVFLFKPGTGQNLGQEAKYFPLNIFGLPDTTAREDVPATRPEQICSLGFGGEIIVGFKNAVLVDRPGADFTIFENAFKYLGNRIYAEPAKIAVSRDGVRFVEFPFDSVTLRGCAGKTPTNGNQSPFNPALSGGDSFDLAAIGMDSVRFIKITDISAIVLNNPQHPFWDVTISGFDLDAVVGLNLAPLLLSTGVNVQNEEPIVDIALTNDIIAIRRTTNNQAFSMRCELYALNGRLILSQGLASAETFIHTSALARGAYFCICRGGAYVFSQTILLW